MSSKFTPGPWRVDTHDDEVVILGKGVPDVVVKHANDARLISAAPELYEALRRCRDQLRAESKEHFDEYILAQEALKKARGEV